MAKITKGYAYAYQALGYLYMKENVESLNEKVLKQFDYYMGEYVYEKIYSELSQIVKR